MTTAGKINTVIGTRQYEGFKEITIDKSMRSLVGKFSFSFDPTKLVISGNQANQPSLGKEVEFYIDNQKYFTGYIEKVRGNYDSKSHNVTFTGREKTADVVDQKIEKGKQYKKNNSTVLTLSNFFTKVMADNGLSNIKVTYDDPYPEIPNYVFKESEQAETTTGQSVFSVLDTYVAKLNAILTTDVDGNILITRGNTVDLIGNLNNTINTFSNKSANNILEADFSVDIGDMYSEYTLVSSLSTIISERAALPVDTKLTSTQTATVKDSESLRDRKFVKIIPTAASESTLKDMAEWYLNLNKTKSATYQCKVFDYYTDSSKLFFWQINKLVQLDDNFSFTKGVYLIESVGFSKSLAGTFTTLSLVNKDAYSNRKYANTIGTGNSQTIASRSTT